jgi:hypothetical protein
MGFRAGTSHARQEPREGVAVGVHRRKRFSGSFRYVVAAETANWPEPTFDLQARGILWRIEEVFIPPKMDASIDTPTASRRRG